MITAIHFSSRTDDWATPRDLFAKLDARWHFDLDPCATPENAVCHRYFTEAENGLVLPWRGRAFLNPPYGRHIGKWVQKTAAEVRLGNAVLVVALLPARTDTRWWRDWVLPWARVRFLTGRLRFGDATAGAPFPSALAFYPKRVRPPAGQIALPFASGGK